GEIELLAVREPGRVGARREVEALHDGARPVGGFLPCEAIDGHQSVERSDSTEVCVGQVPRGVRIEMVSGHVVLVTVTVQDTIGRRSAAGTSHEREGRIDDDGLFAAPYEQRTALRVLAAQPAAEQRDVRTERPVRLPHRTPAMSSMT